MQVMMDEMRRGKMGTMRWYGEWCLGSLGYPRLALHVTNRVT